MLNYWAYPSFGYKLFHDTGIKFIFGRDAYQMKAIKQNHTFIIICVFRID